MAAWTSVTFWRMRLTESRILLILLISNLDLKEEEGSTTSIISPREITSLYFRCRKRCPRSERSSVRPSRSACLRERRHLQRKSERASSSAELRERKRAERELGQASISCSRQQRLREEGSRSTSCPTTTGPRYPPSSTNPSRHTNRPQMLASSAPSSAAATSLSFLLSNSESLSSQSGRYLMTLAPASSARMSWELQMPTLEERWACAMSRRRGRGRVWRESLRESSSSPSLYSQSRLQQSSGMFQKISSILMQVALSFWLMMPTHSFSSALSKCAEMRLSLRKCTESVGTCSTFLRQLLALRRTTDSVRQFSYLMRPFPPSKAQRERRSRSNPKLAQRISFANYSAFLMNCLMGRKGFLLFRSRRCDSFCGLRSAFTSCLGSDCACCGCFSLSSASGARLVEEAGMRKASGNLEEAFLAILGLAMCGSCSIGFKIGELELLIRSQVVPRSLPLLHLVVQAPRLHPHVLRPNLILPLAVLRLKLIGLLLGGIAFVWGLVVEVDGDGVVLAVEGEVF